MADDLIRYDVLVQNALRGVVRKVLREVADDHLPGEHHFYIAFDTTAPGVRMSSRLRQRHPEEMTIVLQHQFWELQVSDHAFEVGLSFGGVPERLLVPFAAINSFYDPSVPFGLQFDPSSVDGRIDKSGVQPSQLPAIAPVSQNSPEDAGAGPAPAEADGRAEADGQDNPAPRSGAEVVDLDAFRKKT
ncbi:MAG: ClpXP protease specificity-enhancing factor SspB [Pseudomonadota bacterium]